MLVLPEDGADRELANGFHLSVDFTRQRQMQVLPVAGGRNEVLERFNSEHVEAMVRYADRFMILLMDFDGEEDWVENAKARIPEYLAERVFILGPLLEPEDLKRANLGAYEEIGAKLADECRRDTDTTWNHPLLRHNTRELDRLREHVRPILF